MDSSKYETFPGCTREDIEYCLTCKWHSTLVSRWVTCDYTLQEEHGKRDCKAGVGCKYHDDGKGRKTTFKRNRNDMVPLSLPAYRVIVEYFGRKKMEEITGYSRTGFDTAKQHGRIRRIAAKRLLEETGIDITGGELIHEE